MQIVLTVVMVITYALMALAPVLGAENAKIPIEEEDPRR